MVSCFVPFVAFYVIVGAVEFLIVVNYLDVRVLWL